MSRRRGMDREEAWNHAARGVREKTVSWLRRTRDLIRTYGEDGAAERMGVSKRTLRAWSSPDRARRRTPNKANQARLVAEHQTPEVRRRVTARRARQFSARGMRVRFTGMTILTIGGKEYERWRAITTDLPPDSADRIMSAFAEGGPDAAQQAFEQEMNEHYLPMGYQTEGVEGWRFGEPTEFELRPSGRDWEDETEW